MARTFRRREALGDTSEENTGSIRRSDGGEFSESGLETGDYAAGSRESYTASSPRASDETLRPAPLRGISVKALRQERHLPSRLLLFA